MEFPFELFITGVFIVASNIVTIQWLKSDLKKHEKIHEAYVKTHEITTSIVRDDINKLFKKTNGIMRRSDVDDIVKNQISPIVKDLSNVTVKIDIMSESIINIDKYMAVLSDRHRRINKKIT